MEIYQELANKSKYIVENLQFEKAPFRKPRYTLKTFRKRGMRKKYLNLYKQVAG